MGSNLLLGLLVYLIGVNLASFFLYGLDKYRARRQMWRIPEHTLLTVAFLGGCIGAAAGMALFHHKTRKTKFRVCIPVAIVLWIGILGCFGGRLACWLWK